MTSCDLCPLPESRAPGRSRDSAVCSILGWKRIISYLRTQLSAQFGRHRVGREYEDNDSTKEFMRLYTALMDSPTVADYETRLADCERMSPEATAYLKRYWPNNHKEKLQSIRDFMALPPSHPLYQDHVDTIQHLDGKDDATIANYCEHTLYQSGLFKTTRYALLQISDQLKNARAEREKQRLDSSYQFSPCEGRFTISRGLPCWHRLAELWRTSGTLQASDYHVHWWVDRNQIAEDVERPGVPLEPRPL
ncbi:hypothetical protein E4U33_004425 [Claviceps sp. LM78 group G4]|nr:hypothetical protein E4U33_004425 [Claviceps sp. LM78 group G4]